MKRFILFLAFCGVASAQFLEIPRVAQKDTLSTRTRITRNFFFNLLNNPEVGRDKYYGPVDLYLRGSVKAETDTLTIEAYGLYFKLLYGASAFDTTAVDSHRVGTMPLTTSSLGKTFVIDPLWTNFPLYDGVRIVIKKGGSDVDSVTTYSNCRLNPNGKR
jgi:hypothetical protein